MTTQPDLFTQSAPSASSVPSSGPSGVTDADRANLRAWLMSHGWQTRREICAGLDWEERKVRDVAETLGTDIIRCQLGFKLTEMCTREDLAAAVQCCDAFESQGKNGRILAQFAPPPPLHNRLKPMPTTSQSCHPGQSSPSVSLSDYDLVVVNTSSGKDSQTTLRFVMTQAAREGYPKDRVVCVHADLGRVEWPGCFDLAQKQADHYGVRLFKKARPQGDLITHIEQRGKFHGPNTRYCTSDHKRAQIYTLFTQFVRELKTDRQVRILNTMGMRAQESPARSKLPPFLHDAQASNGKRHIDRWLPIHSLTIDDVWRDIKTSGVPYHHAYDLGMPRLSCMFCFYAPKSALMIAGKHNPEVLAEYVRVERKTGHKFRSDFSIESVQQAIASGEDLGKATDWVM